MRGSQAGPLSDLSFRPRSDAERITGTFPHPRPSTSSTVPNLSGEAHEGREICPCRRGRRPPACCGRLPLPWPPPPPRPRSRALSWVLVDLSPLDGIAPASRSQSVVQDNLVNALASSSIGGISEQASSARTDLSASAALPSHRANQPLRPSPCRPVPRTLLASPCRAQGLVNNVLAGSMAASVPAPPEQWQFTLSAHTLTSSAPWHAVGGGQWSGWRFGVCRRLRSRPMKEAVQL